MKMILLLSISLTLFSCNQTIENKISDKFTEYVNLEFDDPKILKEIVCIELKDTFNNASLYGIVNSIYEIDSVSYELFESSFRGNTDFFNEMAAHIENNKSIYQNLSYSKKTHLLKLTSELINLSFKRTRANAYKDNKKYIDSVFCTLDTFDVKNYKIRVRLLEGDNLKISDYYCIMEDDSLRFYDKEPSIKELTPKCESFFKVLDKYTKEIEDRTSLAKQRVDKQTEIRDYIQNL